MRNLSRNIGWKDEERENRRHHARTVQNVFPGGNHTHLSVEYCAKSWVQHVQAVLPNINMNSREILQHLSPALTWTRA